MGGFKHGHADFKDGPRMHVCKKMKAAIKFRMKIVVFLVN